MRLWTFAGLLVGTWTALPSGKVTILSDFGVRCSKRLDETGKMATVLGS